MNKGYNRNKRLILAISSLLMLAIYTVTVFALFNTITVTYKEDIVSESSEHLSDINSQVSLLIEEDTDMAWSATESVLHSILSYSDSDAAGMFKFMQEEKDIWDISDVYILTENGNCINSTRDVVNNETASQMIVGATAKGRLLSILRSTLIYTLPVPETSTLTYNGSRIAAISTVRDLDSLIDNLEFSSFGGQAYIYLTQNEGAKISQLTHKDAPDVFNVFSLFEDTDKFGNLTCLEHEGVSINEISKDTISDSCVFLDKAKADGYYVVVTSVDIDEETPLRLFYIVPEKVVNQTMDDFSTHIANTSMSLILALFLMITVAFLIFYSMRGKKYLQEIAAREHLFDLLVSNTQNAFALLHVGSGKPVYVSKNTAAILGHDYFTLHKGFSGYYLYSADSIDEQPSLATINEELESWDGVSKFSSDYIPYMVNDVEHFFVFRLFPNKDDTNEVIATVQDVTKEREREDALRSTLVIADSANIAKTRFLSNMSHDIRTPMNAIVNMTDFALDSLDDKAKLTEYLGIIKDSSAHLLHLINDILDMSRIESGKMIIEAESFNIVDTLINIEEIIKVLTNQKNQHFVINHDIKTPALIGDRLKVSQILMNILNNAVKFTPEKGTITFTVTELRSLKSEMGVFSFTVNDTGIGIDKEKLDHIFEPFSRGNDARVEKIEGSGLGLSICKNYVEAMGGFLSVSSRVGSGSTFSVELNFPKDFSNIEVTEKPMGDNAASFEGKRALLIEDNEINRAVAMMILVRLGFEVDTAFDGQEGYRKFIASEKGYYDIIYMDVQMPVMNGYESTAAIRDSSHPQSASIPIVAMTANVFAEDVERARASGMDGHVGKPIVIDELVDETNKVFQRKNI